MNYRPKAFTKNLDSAGTSAPISTTDIKTRSVVIQARAGNAGTIYVGGADVDASHSVRLAPGDSVTIEAPGDPAAYISMSDVYFDGTNTNDDIDVVYLEKM